MKTDAVVMIVLTGELKSCDREEFVSIAEAAGFSVAMSVSRHTAYLVCGDNAKTEKIDRAKQLGIPVLAEDDFWSLLYSKKT